MATRRLKHITRSMSGFRGKSPSTDATAMVPARSILEQDALVLVALSRGVKSYRSHQVEELYYDGTEQRRCYPDYLLELVAGPELILDVHSANALKDPEEARRFELIAVELARQGRPYRLITEQEIYRQPKFDIAKRLLYHRNRLLPTDDTAGMVEWVYVHGPSSLSELQQHFGDARLPLRLLADGYLRCNFSQPLTGESIVNVAPEKDDQLLF